MRGEGCGVAGLRVESLGARDAPEEVRLRVAGLRVESLGARDAPEQVRLRVAGLRVAG